MVNIARVYHKHRVTRNDGVYYHKISIVHRSEFGKLEHNKEISSYREEMSVWRKAYKRIKSFGGKVRKYRKKVFIGGVPTLVGLLAILSLIPGVVVTGLTDVWCGDICKIPFQICTYKYDLVFREDAQPFYFMGDAKLDSIIKDGKPFSFSGKTLHVGECWNLTAIIKKDEWDSVKYGFKAGDFELDPILYSEVRRARSIDRAKKDGGRHAVFSTGLMNVYEDGVWKDKTEANNLMNVPYGYKQKFVYKDDRFVINITRANFNTTNLCLKSSITGNIPIKVYKIRKPTVKEWLTAKKENKTLPLLRGRLIFNRTIPMKKNMEICKKINISLLDKIIDFGTGTSTTYVITTGTNDDEAYSSGHNVGDPFATWGYYSGIIYQYWTRYNITIPDGSSITLAKEDVFAADSQTTDFTTLISYELTDSCSDFSTNPWSRTCSDTVSWTTPDFSATERYNTTDFSNLVQEFIDRPGYDDGGSHICIKLNSTDATSDEYRPTVQYDYSSDYSALLHIDYTTSAGNPSVNLSFGPPDTTAFVFSRCGPDFQNDSAIPINQTDTYGIDYVCNNGTASGDIQIKLSGTLNQNWTIWADNESTMTNPLTLSTTWQTIYYGMAQDSCGYVWFKANCSYVHVGPGVYEIYQAI